MGTLRSGTKTIGTWFGVKKDSGLYDNVGYMSSGRDERKAREKNRRDKRKKIDAPVMREALGAEERRRIAADRARGGRLATILSDSERLGG